MWMKFFPLAALMTRGSSNKKCKKTGSITNYLINTMLVMHIPLPVVLPLGVAIGTLVPVDKH